MSTPSRLTATNDGVNLAKQYGGDGSHCSVCIPENWEDLGHFAEALLGKDTAIYIVISVLVTPAVLFLIALALDSNVGMFVGICLLLLEYLWIDGIKG